MFCLGNMHFSMLLTKFILNNFQYFALLYNEYLNFIFNVGKLAEVQNL